MNCMTFGGVGVRGGRWLSMGAPSTHKISGLSLTKHVHLWENGACALE